MNKKEMRLAILKEVESGSMSVDEGSHLIAALEGVVNTPGETNTATSNSENVPLLDQGSIPSSQESKSEPVVEPVPPLNNGSTPPLQPEVVATLDEKYAEKRLQYWRRWWILPFSIGLILTILGAYWMYLGWMASGPGWGFWLSWIPFGLGILLTVLSWYSQEVPWLYLRVRQKPGQKPQTIVIVLPLPLNLAAWVFRNFGHYMPEDLRDKNLGDTLDELGKSFKADAPLEVYVDDEDGDKVEIIIAGGRKTASV